MIVATGTKNPAATGAYTVVDAIDVPAGADTSGLYASVPQEPGTSITLNGRDAKLLVAGYDMDGQRLQYSTSELMTHARIGDSRRRAALRSPGRGRRDRPPLRRRSRRSPCSPASVTSTWDATRGDLRLDYTHDGLARVLIAPAGGTPLELLLATDEVAAQFWRQDTAAGPVLVRGSRAGALGARRRRTLALTGDTTGPTSVELLAAPSIAAVTWNGRRSCPPARLGWRADGDAWRARCRSASPR